MRTIILGICSVYHHTYMRKHLRSIEHNIKYNRHLCTHIPFIYDYIINYPIQITFETMFGHLSYSSILLLNDASTLHNIISEYNAHMYVYLRGMYANIFVCRAFWCFCFQMRCGVIVCAVVDMVVRRSTRIYACDFVFGMIC